MNRRAFLQSLVGGVVTTAAVRTWPFRVFSFPTDIVVARTPWPDSLTAEEMAWLNRVSQEYWHRNTGWVGRTPVVNHDAAYYQRRLR